MTAFILNESTGEYHVNGPVSRTEILDQAKEILLTSIKRSSLEEFTEPSSVKAFLHLALAGQPREIFACLFLDNRHRLIAYEELFFGTVDGSAVHPRVVVQRALHHNASAVILAHNHPSGISEPSQADRRITERLKDALGLVETRVLDHFIVGEEITSMAERGML